MYKKALKSGLKFASKIGKKAYEGGKSLAKKGIEKGIEKSKQAVKEGKRKIALEVIDDTKDKVATNQKVHLKASEELVRNNYAKGGGVAFKPYGKTKGLFSITYIEDGEAQSETWESLEMAMDRVKRLQKMSDVSNVKLVTPKMAKGGGVGNSNSWNYTIGGL